jgi:DNA-directed RNA polymerase specialized sigma24 family protein
MFRYANGNRGLFGACEGFGEAEVVASLETALRSLPNGREWLTLIREGYTAEEARRKLGMSRGWLARAREACRRALEVHG